MASFTIYDPKTKAFRALETTSDADLPFEQVLLINILVELRVIALQLSLAAGEAEPDDVEVLRAGIVHEL